MSSLSGRLKAWTAALVAEARAVVAPTGRDNGFDGAPIPDGVAAGVLDAMRSAVANGYWQGRVQVEEIRAALSGRRYRGRVMLSDDDEGERIRAALDAFAAGGDGWEDVVPRDALDWLRGYVPKLAGVLEEDVLRRVRDAISEAIEAGRTTEQAMELLREADATVGAFASHRVEAIVRTETMRGYNMGHLIALRGAEGATGVEFSAILDDRTSDACRAREGLRLRLDDPRLVANAPPIHPNCRSVLIPILDDEVPDNWRGDEAEADALAATDPTRQRPEDLEAVRRVLGSAKPGGGARKDEEPPAPEKVQIRLPIITDHQRRAWAEKVLDGAPEEIRRIVAREAPSVKYTEDGATGWAGGKYRLNVGSSSHGNEEDYAHVFYHEFGHVVDARSAKAGLRLSGEPGSSFGQAYAADRAKFMGRARPEKEEKLAAMRLVADRSSKWYNSREVSDIICSMSKGAISGSWGHSGAYYKQKGNGEAEVFANLFALKAQCKDEAFEVVRSLFPKVVRAFEDFLAQTGGV